MDPNRISLLWWDQGSQEPAWSLGKTRRIHSLVDAAAVVDREAEGNATWLFLWAPRLGPPPTNLVRELALSTADAWHAGLLCGAQGQPDDLDLVRPTWYFTLDPPVDSRAVSWRFTLDALLLRTEVVRRLGGVDPAFRTREAAALDMGWRYLRAGAIPMYEPRLIGDVGAALPYALEPVERYVLLGRHLPRKWVRYVALRRALTHGRPGREIRALRSAFARLATVSSPSHDDGLYQRPRPATSGESASRVSVVLPTLGRYELVTRVLEDLRAQTVPPTEIICVDQTRPHDPAVFEPYFDLPLTVICQEEKGQWLSRNEAVSRSRCDLLLFLDDDSHVPPEFIERHLECLEVYDADVSAGASLSVVGAPVPDNYRFYRVADQFDSGNALVRRNLLVRIGAFDRQFDRMRSGDAEFGLRAHMAGAVSIHNPLAYRVHYKAAEGGLRSFGSWDLFRQRGLLSPLPLPSVIYFAMRYFTPRQVREQMLVGLVAGLVPYKLKRRTTAAAWVKYGFWAALRAPFLVVRVWRSVRQARRMLAQGPRIAAVEPTPTSAG